MLADLLKESYVVIEVDQSLGYGTPSGSHSPDGETKNKTKQNKKKNQNLRIRSIVLRNKMVPVNFLQPVMGLDLHDKSTFRSNRHWVIASIMTYDLDEVRFINHADELVASWPSSEIESVSIPVLDEKTRVVIAQKSSDYQTEVKKQRPNAWSRWTTQEDEELVNQINQGLDCDEIADIHRRTPLAIHERLRKLGIEVFEYPKEGIRVENRTLKRLAPWEGKIPSSNIEITVCLGCGYEIHLRPCKCWAADDTSGTLVWRDHQWIYSLYGVKLRRREY